MIDNREAVERVILVAVRNQTEKIPNSPLTSFASLRQLQVR